MLRVRPRMVRFVRFFSILGFGLLALGCGRRATRSDCELVVDRNVELQLKQMGIVDPAIVAKRKEEMRGSMKDDLDRCVGRRVTDGTLACVKTAESADAIDKCLR